MNKLERNYTEQTSLEHRKKFGQFYTLDKIANYMMSWLLQSQPSQILDPAFGMGAFFRAYKYQNYNKPYIGKEIDLRSYRFFLENEKDRLNLQLQNEDYFESWDQKYDSIICNPPYLKFQKFASKDVILSRLSKYVGERVSGYINTASAFLLKSVMELNDGGRLAYIMPLEFLNTGYGTLVKKKLLEQGDIHQIIQIEDENSAFEGVLTTICVILFEKNKKLNHVKFSKLKSISTMEIQECNSISKKKLNPLDKWLPFFDNNYSEPDEIFSDFVPLCMYGKFKRGIATGANEFFVLNKSDVEKYKISPTDYCQCITRSQQVKKLIFNQSDVDELISSDSPMYLFKPRLNQIEPNVREYIRYGEKQKYNERYLTKNRNPWYSVEYREASPILFGVFSREGFKVIRNTTNCLNLTCFHGFIPNPIFESYIDKLFLFLNSDLGFQMINRNKRVYGNKLSKFEPNDLKSVLVPPTHKLDLLSNDFVQAEIKNIREKGSLSAHAQGVFYKMKE